MNEEQLIEFINWLPTAVPEFKNAEPEQIVQALNQMYESEEGQQMLSQLFTAFQESKADVQSQMFKKGGKLSQLVEKAKKGKKMCCKKKEVLQGGMVNKVAEKMQNGGSFYRNWSEGDIRKLQMFLAREDMLGNEAYKGDLDGIVGPEFIRAVRAYQRKHNFKDDGMWGYNTNQVHRVLDTNILAKGSYKPTYGQEQGDLYAYPTSFSYTKLSDLPQADAKKAIDYYSLNPELLFSDNAEHSKWRQIFQNSGDAGEEFLTLMYNGLLPEEQNRIDSRKLTDSVKLDQVKENIATGRDEVAKRLGPILAAPIAIEAAIGGAGLLGTGATALRTAGLAGRVGRTAQQVGKAARLAGRKMKRGIKSAVDDYARIFDQSSSSVGRTSKSQYRKLENNNWDTFVKEQNRGERGRWVKGRHNVEGTGRDTGYIGRTSERVLQEGGKATFGRKDGVNGYATSDKDQFGNLIRTLSKRDSNNPGVVWYTEQRITPRDTTYYLYNNTASLTPFDAHRFVTPHKYDNMGFLGRLFNRRGENSWAETFDENFEE